MNSVNRNDIKLIVFLFCLCVYILDLITTGLCLNYIEGAFETNRFGAFLFSFGIVGYILDSIFIIIVLYCIIYLAFDVCVVKLFKLMRKEEMNDNMYVFLNLVFLAGFTAGELVAIINNISLLF